MRGHGARPRTTSSVPRAARVPRGAFALAIAAAAWAAGCADCGRAPRTEAHGDDGGAASTASAGRASPDASAPGDAPVAATVIARGLGKPRSLVVDATHVYFADALAGTIARVPREGGDKEDLATGRDAPARLARSGGELVWLDGGGPLPKVDTAGSAGRRGVFACSLETIPCTVRTVRAGAFVSLVATGGELLVAENLDAQRFAVSRVTGETQARLGEHEGRAIAMTASDTNAYVAMVGPSDRPKLVTLPRAKGAPSEIQLRGPGLNNVEDDGDHLLATGILDRKFGLFRIAKSTSDVAFLAPDVAPGLFARHDGAVYFVSGRDRTLRKVPITGGEPTIIGRLPGIEEPAGLAIEDGWAYVSGKAAGDAGSTGTIVRLSMR